VNFESLECLISLLFHTDSTSYKTEDYYWILGRPQWPGTRR